MQNAVCEILVRIVRSSPHISWGWDLVWRRGNNPHTITEFYLTTSPPTILPSLPESHTTKQTQCGGILLITLHLIWGRGDLLFPYQFWRWMQTMHPERSWPLIDRGPPSRGPKLFWPLGRRWTRGPHSSIMCRAELATDTFDTHHLITEEIDIYSSSSVHQRGIFSWLRYNLTEITTSREITFSVSE